MSMKSTSRLIIGLVTVLLWSTTQAAAEQSRQDPTRIVSLGGAITEIIYALGVEGLLVGVDSTSQWPVAAQNLPQVGYVRALSAEGILALAPDRIILSDYAGPAQVITQLRESGFALTPVTTRYTPAGIKEKIKVIANVVARPERGAALTARIDRELQELRNMLKNKSESPRVALFLAVTQGRLNAAGKNTAGAAMISLAGGTNVFNDFDGYKPISHEAMVAAQPDVIVVTSRVSEAMNGKAALQSLPAFTATPAGKNGRIVQMDTQYLLGFGPRTVQAALELGKHLHSD